MNKIILGICLLANVSFINAMQYDEKNAFGMTPLHCAPLLTEFNANRSDLSALDLNKAKIAAYLIMNFGADVSEVDKFGYTPLTYAEAIKSKLPKVYEVMKAGKIKQDTEKKLPQPDKNGVFDLQTLMEFGRSKTSSEINCLEWQMALNTLNKYLEK